MCGQTFGSAHSFPFFSREYHNDRGAFLLSKNDQLVLRGRPRPRLRSDSRGRSVTDGCTPLRVQVTPSKISRTLVDRGHVPALQKNEIKFFATVGLCADRGIFSLLGDGRVAISGDGVAVSGIGLPLVAGFGFLREQVRHDGGDDAAVGDNDGILLGRV